MALMVVPIMPRWAIMQPSLYYGVNGSLVKLWGCAFVVLLIGLSFVCLALRSVILAWRHSQVR